MSSIFLTENELQTLTGCKYASHQRNWFCLLYTFAAARPTTLRQQRLIE
ncbi:DUF4224 domain-containing protein, partial [Escherichia coli]